MEELRGRMFGKYRIGNLLGQGNRASVYQAVDAANGAAVALRIIDRTLSGDATFEGRFRRMMSVVAGLHHPNLLPVLDHGFHDGFAFLTRPLITTGTTLRAILGTPLSPAVVSNLLRPVASALDYAHSRGVAHSDLKPGSILLPQPDRPLLADLGIAPVTAQSNNVIATAKGLNFGTPEYLAPEQVQGVASDHRVDFYALGVILYEALVGRPPFRAERSSDTPRQVAFSHLAMTPPAPRVLNPALSPAVEQVILQSLEKRPERRFPTGMALFDALDSAQFGYASQQSPRKGLTQVVRQAPPPAAPIAPAAPPPAPEQPQPNKPARGWSRTRI